MKGANSKSKAELNGFCQAILSISHTLKGMSEIEPVGPPLQMYILQSAICVSTEHQVNFKEALDTEGEMIADVARCLRCYVSGIPMLIEHSLQDSNRAAKAGT